MCIWSDISAVQDDEMHYMNAWLKRCVFNLDLNRESVSEPRTLSGRLFQSLGAKYEKVLPPLVDFAILGTTKSPEFCDRSNCSNMIIFSWPGKDSSRSILYYL